MGDGGLRQGWPLCGLACPLRRRTGANLQRLMGGQRGRHHLMLPTEDQNNIRNKTKKSWRKVQGPREETYRDRGRAVCRPPEPETPSATVPLPGLACGSSNTRPGGTSVAAP